MRRLIVIFFLSMCSAAHAQIIDNAEGTAFVGDHFFNCDFIKINGIASIEELYQVKRDGHPIVSNKGSVFYQFDDVGQLISRTETRSYFSQITTTVSTYSYEEGQLVSECTEMKSGITCSDHTFKEGRKVTTCYSKKSVDDTGKELILNVNCEEFQWSGNSDLTQQYKVLNNHGLPYSTVVVNYDENGYLMSKSERHLRGGWSRKTGYEYNERGWVHVKTSQEKSEEPVVEHFTYDDLGNLELVETTEGDVWKKTDTIYSKDGLLEALLRTSSENSDIHIVKYKYRFRPE